MKLRAITLACMSIALPNGAHAADDFCSRLVVQALTQICRYLPSGVSVCQPVAVVGPNPECSTPERTTMVPLGPATLQAAAPWAAPYGAAPNLPALSLPSTAHPASTVATAMAPVAAATSTTTSSRNAILPAAPAVAPQVPVITAKPTQPAVAATIPAATGSTNIQAATPPTPVVTATAPTAKPALLPVAATTPAATVNTNTQPPPPATPVVTATPPAAKPALLPVAATTPTAAGTTTTQPTTPAMPVVTATAPAARPALPAVAITTPTTQPTASGKTARALTPISPLPGTGDSAWPEDMADGHTADPTGVDALAHFAFDSADLTPAGRAVLDAWVAEAPANKKVKVSGYTDRLGPEPYNLKLSLRRAQSVKQYLVGKGVTPRRVQVEAKGEADPVKQCKGGSTPATKACLAPNRRVQVDTE